ncbi:hypothetical protein E1A91_D02G142200v1 [Gossypium mustelinum]|uniref:Uncharacterized protein n=4 Tax=Gossypium TaxID=3633 RepID=A0A5J5SC73_GOSBA|nr:hypothetical protein ES319_D02G136300v1 [Gossypium barbadense]PPD78457.1 hypothetical protein GOBAR_DD24617 [Gossypium barbadense]TYG79523.1 hypothetical protein ES288_D02G145000v1 [Gossypium darwinii]TYH83732.1 hypothetical protein ES332_D02G151300v1 [Gossypium tomentosum]TYI93536.1 hypothetical protein E1A91_D02G142200v1 [Gossypium mustelinum]
MLLEEDSIRPTCLGIIDPHWTQAHQAQSNTREQRVTIKYPREPVFKAHSHIITGASIVKSQPNIPSKSTVAQDMAHILIGYMTTRTVGIIRNSLIVKT